MTGHRLAAFFDRFDSVKPHRPAENALSDAGMREAHDVVLPIYLRICERAGIELDDLWDQQRERIDPLPPLIIGRASIGGRALDDEIRAALVSVAAESFLAGVLWQQEAELPDLDQDADDADR